MNGLPDCVKWQAGQYLRSLTRTDYDDLGRAWRTSAFSINPDTGGDPTAGKTPAQIDALAALRSHAWYDKRGNVIKISQPDGLVTKMRYDGAGRLTKTFATDGGGDSAWIDATNVDGDIVLEQAEYAYDKNSNVTLVTSRQRFHDATGTGELGTPAGSQPRARVSYAAAYYDALNRGVADVNVGTNGGVAWTRPGSVPARSDTALITSYTYDQAGLLWKVHDPKGIETRMLYDALGRTTATIEAYVDGVPSDNYDRITRYTYDGNDNVLTLTADLPAGQNDQTTVYTYGVTTAGGSSINHNGLLASVTYPSDGNPSTSETESFTYNALGQVTSKADRNGTVHSYGYDPLGRLVSDTVTTLGAGVDGAVRRLGYTYNGQGQPEKITSYANTGGTNVVNEVQRQYNGLGQLITNTRPTTAL